ncbi:MAG: thiamine pyrophosphate-dependent enzyme [Bdellovibrionales bacterium]
MNAEKILNTAFLIRRTEEKLLELFTQGKVHGTIHTCVGQEMVGACLAEHLSASDYVFSNHRGHGHYLAVTGDLPGMLGELLGRGMGVAGGVGGSQHLQKGRFFSNGIQGGIVPLAAGAAWGAKLEGKKSIAVVLVGDGTLGQGAIYETMNLSARWQLPLLIVNEDNGYAQSTSKQETFAGDLRARVQGFGCSYAQGDTWDWPTLHQIFADQIQALRAGGPPCFIAVRTYRLKAHSKGDDLRDPQEVKRYFDLDPLQKLLSAKDAVALHADQKASNEIEKQIQKVLAAPVAQPPALAAYQTPKWFPWKSGPEGLYVEALAEAFQQVLANHPQVLFIGEDVQDPYGGCFKASKGLSSRQAQRVRNTPISEAAISGVGTGVALAGYPCFVEYMFGDFSALAFDQIVNHAAKFDQMYPGVKAQVIFRTPMGGGQGYGPTHSQNLEKHFLGVPGLQVYAMNAMVDPRLFLDDLVKRQSGPVLLIENKKLYLQKTVASIDSMWQVQTQKDSWNVRLKPKAGPAQVNLVGHGAYATILMNAAKTLFVEHEILCSLFIATRLSDFDLREELQEWLGTPVHLLFEEGQGYASFSAEVAAQLAEYGVKARRWFPPARVVPSAPSLESEFRLSEAKVIAECLEVLQ